MVKRRRWLASRPALCQPVRIRLAVYRVVPATSATSLRRKGKGIAVPAVVLYPDCRASLIRVLYSDSIQLSISLYLDVKKVLETSEIADLDNYAKMILDALKGPEGIMLDDTQVQGFCISWIDGYEKPKFTLEAKGNQDDFVLSQRNSTRCPTGCGTQMVGSLGPMGRRNSMKPLLRPNLKFLAKRRRSESQP